MAIYIQTVVEMVLRQLNEDTSFLNIMDYNPHVLSACNEALAEIYKNKLDMICTQTVNITDSYGYDLNHFNDSFLEVLSVKKDGEPVDYRIEGIFLKPDTIPISGVTVTFKSYPKITSPNEQLTFRENLSYMLADYAVYKILSSGGAERQTRAQAYYQSYLRAYAKITPDNAAKIVNKY